MKRIENFMLPEHTNNLYKNEAVSSIALAKEVADKINELVDAYNQFNNNDLTWKHEQEGKIRKAVLYMKDNLVNSLKDLLNLYDPGTIQSLIINTYGKELNDLKVFATPQMYGASGTGNDSDVDIKAVNDALNSLEQGGVLYFPVGFYNLANDQILIDKDDITFAGPGLIQTKTGFKIRANNFKAIGLNIEGLEIKESSRAFDIRPENNEYFSNFIFKDCNFENFFYAVSAVGGAYNFDGTEAKVGYRIRDVIIENCISSTSTAVNCGHFQCIQVENISYINNRTYGGTTASSYNAIKGNGYIRVIGNYDHNNKYASCEIENGSGKTVIANNTFKSKIWVDDSFDAVVNGNVTDEGILISVGSDNGDAKNIVISNNVCKNIRCERFGTYVGGIIHAVNIIGNTVRGDNTHGVWIHGNAVQHARISENFITGVNTNDIAIQRNDQLVCFVQSNFCNGKNLLIAGSGGKVYAVDNINVNVSGNRDSLPVSHLEREFNGVKVTDTAGVPYRINVNTSGGIFATKY